MKCYLCLEPIASYAGVQIEPLTGRYHHPLVDSQIPGLLRFTCPTKAGMFVGDGIMQTIKQEKHWLGLPMDRCAVCGKQIHDGEPVGAVMRATHVSCALDWSGTHDEDGTFRGIPIEAEKNIDACSSPAEHPIPNREAAGSTPARVAIHAPDARVDEPPPRKWVHEGSTPSGSSTHPSFDPDKMTDAGRAWLAKAVSDRSAKWIAAPSAAGFKLYKGKASFLAVFARWGQAQHVAEAFNQYEYIIAQARKDRDLAINAYKESEKAVAHATAENKRLHKHLARLRRRLDLVWDALKSRSQQPTKGT